MHDPEFPATIRAGRLALAAGRAGYSIPMAHHGISATLMAEVWQVHAQEVGEEGVIHVASRRGLRQLIPPGAQPGDNRTRPTAPRLVLVQDIRLLKDIARQSQGPAISGAAGSDLTSC